jgi:hypothetical protein
MENIKITTKYKKQKNNNKNNKHHNNNNNACTQSNLYVYKFKSSIYKISVTSEMNLSQILKENSHFLAYCQIHSTYRIKEISIMTIPDIKQGTSPSFGYIRMSPYTSQELGLKMNEMDLQLNTEHEHYYHFKKDDLNYFKRVRNCKILDLEDRYLLAHLYEKSISGYNLQIQYTIIFFGKDPYLLKPKIPITAMVMNNKPENNCVHPQENVELEVVTG